MYRITHQSTRLIFRLSAALFGVLTALIMVMPPVLAATQVFTVACQNSDVVVKAHSAACSASPATLQLYGVGTSVHKPLPSGKGITSITVDCGSNTPVTPTVHSTVTFSCHNGSTPTLKNAKVLQHGTGPATPPPAPTGPVAPNSNCSQTQCDLIALYINPAINLLSVIFGLMSAISLILGGIQFSTSEGDPQKASKAKNRISNTILAIFAYAVLYGFLQFLVPGGFLH